MATNWNAAGTLTRVSVELETRRSPPLIAEALEAAIEGGSLAGAIYELHAFDASLNTYESLQAVRGETFAVAALTRTNVSLVFQTPLAASFGTAERAAVGVAVAEALPFGGTARLEDVTVRDVTFLGPTVVAFDVEMALPASAAGYGGAELRTKIASDVDAGRTEAAVRLVSKLAGSGLVSAIVNAAATREQLLVGGAAAARGSFKGRSGNAPARFDGTFRLIPTGRSGVFRRDVQAHSDGTFRLAPAPRKERAS